MDISFNTTVVWQDSLVKKWMVGDTVVSLHNLTDGYLCVFLALECFKRMGESSLSSGLKSAYSELGNRFGMISNQIFKSVHRVSFASRILLSGFNTENIKALLNEEFGADFNADHFAVLSCFSRSAICWLSHDVTEAARTWNSGRVADSRFSQLVCERLKVIKGIKVVGSPYDLDGFITPASGTDQEKFDSLYWQMRGLLPRRLYFCEHNTGKESNDQLFLRANTQISFDTELFLLGGKRSLIAFQGGRFTIDPEGIKFWPEWQVRRDSKFDIGLINQKLPEGKKWVVFERPNKTIWIIDAQREIEKHFPSFSSDVPLTAEWAKLMANFNLVMGRNERGPTVQIEKVTRTSQFDPTVKVCHEIWAITLAKIGRATQNSSIGSHAALFIEGIQEGNPYFRLADISAKTSNAKLAEKRIQDPNTVYGGKFDPNRITTRSPTWTARRTSVMKHIIEKAEDNIPFNLISKNCLCWSVGRLRDIGVNLPDGEAKDPKHYIKKLPQIHKLSGDLRRGSSNTLSQEVYAWVLFALKKRGWSDPLPAEDALELFLRYAIWRDSFKRLSNIYGLSQDRCESIVKTVESILIREGALSHKVNPEAKHVVFLNGTTLKRQDTTDDFSDPSPPASVITYDLSSWKTHLKPDILDNSVPRPHLDPFLKSPCSFFEKNFVATTHTLIYFPASMTPTALLNALRTAGIVRDIHPDFTSLFGNQKIEAPYWGLITHMPLPDSRIFAKEDKIEQNGYCLPRLDEIAALIALTYLHTKRKIAPKGVYLCCAEKDRKGKPFLVGSFKKSGFKVTSGTVKFNDIGNNVLSKKTYGALAIRRF